MPTNLMFEGVSEGKFIVESDKCMLPHIVGTPVQYTLLLRSAAGVDDEATSCTLCEPGDNSQTIAQQRYASIPLAISDPDAHMHVPMQPRFSLTHGAGDSRRLSDGGSMSIGCN